MNKIIIVNDNIIPYINEEVIIDNNVITFTKNGNYIISYEDTSNIDISIVVSDNICINLFEYSNNDNIISNIKYILGKNSTLIVNKFYYNNSTNEKVNVYLNGSKSSIKYNFSSISTDYDKYLLNIYHKDKNTSSDIFNRTIAKKNSSNVFDINSYVENGIKDCYLNQSTKIITLGESDNKINPNMFIGEVSTTAIHSSVVGNVNEDELFYLMSRGISYKDAINIIVKGIILSNIIPNMEYREKILLILNDLGGE